MPQLHKEAVRRLFDGLALEYASGRDRQASFRAQKHTVLALLEGAGDRVLDVGCGPALLEAELLRRGHEVVGIDVSLEMLRCGLNRLAGSPYRDRCRLLPGDVERLRFADSEFDAVACMGVLEYLPAYARALREMRRVLRPGGIAVISVPNRVSLYHLSLAALRVAKRTLGRPAPAFIPNRCVPWVLLAQMSREGFQVLETQRCGAQYIVKARRALP
ncbi:MAG: class I SAM-dependent methyltransferase [Betaproteobacteria bacterium]